MAPFMGVNIYLSRNLIPPEIFDTLHDALNHGGATVFLCSDPSRNSPNDYHIISSNLHDKFEDLQKKGCRMLGPQCVLSCAKEYRPLPNQGFTCCLAMDGDKVLASGFEADEKLEIGKMVIAMGGVVHTKASLDVTFVIVKNVLAAKYKWALNAQKPTVTLSWLHQCWKEHHLVPHESYRVLPFSGLTICVSKVPAAERNEIEKVVLQNGGKYSAELTRKCTHLICDPNLDKNKSLTGGKLQKGTNTRLPKDGGTFLSLQENGLINLLPEKGVSVPKFNGTRTCSSAQCSQDKGVGSSELVAYSAGESNLGTPSHANEDIEVTLSQNVSNKEPPIGPKEELKTENDVAGCVADDSQSEDNDLYLADCRIHLRGFDALEMRTLVSMVRRGGGSRYMALNEKLSHIVIGNLSETEKKEVRVLAALGVIYVVRPAWLQDCDREKKEVPVLRRHIAHDLLLLKDSMGQSKGETVDMSSLKQKKVSTVQSASADDNLHRVTDSGAGSSLDKNTEVEVKTSFDSSMRAPTKSDAQGQFSSLIGKAKDGQKIQHDMKSSVFEGKFFCFGSSFPHDRRAEIIEWINLGRGRVVDDQTQQKVHFMVECHGVITGPFRVSGGINVSSHWIRSCLEDGWLLDVASHVLYSPLPCRIPFPGFEQYRFCVSQYDEKDRRLLRNLCNVLGAKFVEKLTNKVTHLLCKFTNGPKYDAASKWGIQSITCDWIYECVKQNEIASLCPFTPKAVTSKDHGAGFCTLTQNPTQAARLVASQFTNQPKGLKCIRNQASTSDSGEKYEKPKTDRSKRAKTVEDDNGTGSHFPESNHTDYLSRTTLGGKEAIEINLGESDVVPDVAAAIEDLLEQTSKIHDLKSTGSNRCDNNLFSSACTMPERDYTGSRTAFGLTERWFNRPDIKDDTCTPLENANMGTYDGFSETQTDSQVVGYEEDLSGRQMIIDRVRTRSSMN